MSRRRQVQAFASTLRFDSGFHSAKELARQAADRMTYLGLRADAAALFVESGSCASSSGGRSTTKADVEALLSAHGLRRPVSEGPVTPEYQDFTIDLRSARSWGLEARVAESPCSRSRPVPFELPFALAELESLLGSYDVPGEMIEKQAPFLNKSARETREKIQALFKPSLNRLFVKCRDAASREGRCMRLRLRFQADDPLADTLAAVPWEWRATRGRRNSSPSIPVLRRCAKPPFPPRAAGAMSPAPHPGGRRGSQDAEGITLNQEIDRMTASLRPLLRTGRVELIPLAVPTAEAMREALLDQDKEIHVLHFMGHGGYDSRSGAGAIFFEKSGYRRSGGRRRARRLSQTIPSLRLVVLNACKTARHKGSLGSPLELWRRREGPAPDGIPAVVANQCSISGAAAIQFSRIFYRRIATGSRRRRGDHGGQVADVAQERGMGKFGSLPEWPDGERPGVEVWKAWKIRGDRRSARRSRSGPPGRAEHRRVGKRTWRTPTITFSISRSYFKAAASRTRPGGRKRFFPSSARS